MSGKALAGAHVRIEVENGVVMTSTLNARAETLHVAHIEGIEWFVLRVDPQPERPDGSYEVYEIVDVDAESSTPGNFIYELRSVFSMPAPAPSEDTGAAPEEQCAFGNDMRSEAAKAVLAALDDAFPEQPDAS